MNQIETFELAGQYCGGDAHEAIRPLFRSLKHAFAAFREYSYSKEIAQFSFVLRVDGSVRSWGFEGTDAIKFNRKERYVTADVGVPQSWWQGLPPETVLDNLGKGLLNALLDMLAFLKLKGVEVDSEKVMADFSKALDRAKAEPRT